MQFGTYNPPPGKSSKLTKNADGTYKYETLNRAVLKFNAAGKAETYTEPSGVQARFTYSGNDLTQVQNSLGRTLAFTNAGGRITQVSDGKQAGIEGRVIVEMEVDENGNVARTTVIGEPPKLLADAAVSAVSQWKFRPHTYRGAPVKVRLRQPITFRLVDDPALAE